MPRNQRSRKDRKKNKQNQKQNNGSSSNSSVPKEDEKHASEKLKVNSFKNLITLIGDKVVIYELRENFLKARMLARGQQTLPGVS
jgi:hypothetical protein